MRLARMPAYIVICIVALALGGCSIMPVVTKKHKVHEQPEAEFPSCLEDTNPRLSYRKNVLVPQFSSVEQGHVRGLTGIGEALGQHLSERVSLDHYIVQTLDQTIDLEQQNVDLHGRVLSLPEQIKALAAKHNAQFVVRGEVLDMRQQTKRTHFSTHYRHTPVLGSYTHDPDRTIALRLQVYDGSNGTLLDQQKFTGWSKDSADLDRQRTLLSESFMESPIGKALDKMLDQQGAYVSGLLSCIPMQSKIAQLHKRQQGVIPVGTMAGLRPGDNLMVFRADGASGVYRTSESQRQIGQATVKQVHPESALIELQENTIKSLRVGDVVRAW